MRKLAGSPIIHALAASLGVFIVLAEIFGTGWVNTVLDGVIIVAALFVVRIYLPAFWRRRGEPVDRETMLIFGITISWTFVAAIRSWRIVWAALGQPAWLTSENISFGLGSTILLFAAAAHILAASTGKGLRSVPRRGWVRLGVVFTVGAALGVAMIFARRYLGMPPAGG